MAKWWSPGVALLLALGAAPVRAQESASIASASVARVTLAISSNDADLLLLAKLPSEPGYSELCAPPCSVALRPAAYELSLRRSGTVLPTQQLFYFAEDSTLKIEYESHALHRAAGWVILAVGVVGGAALAVTSRRTEEYVDGDVLDRRRRTNSAQLAIGIGLMGAGLGIGIPFITTSDRVSYDLAPRLP